MVKVFRVEALQTSFWCCGFSHKRQKKHSDIVRKNQKVLKNIIYASMYLIFSHYIVKDLCLHSSQWNQQWCNKEFFQETTQLHFAGWVMKLRTSATMIKFTMEKHTLWHMMHFGVSPLLLCLCVHVQSLPSAKVLAGNNPLPDRKHGSWIGPVL